MRCAAAVPRGSSSRYRSGRATPLRCSARKPTRSSATRSRGLLRRRPLVSRLLAGVRRRGLAPARRSGRTCLTRHRRPDERRCRAVLARGACSISRRTAPRRPGVPPRRTGLVIFAHGSGSSRLSPRNRVRRPHARTMPGSRRCCSICSPSWRRRAARAGVRHRAARRPAGGGDTLGARRPGDARAADRLLRCLDRRRRRAPARRPRSATPCARSSRAAAGPTSRRPPRRGPRADAADRRQPRHGGAGAQPARGRPRWAARTVSRSSRAPGTCSRSPARSRPSRGWRSSGSTPTCAVAAARWRRRGRPERWPPVAPCRWASAAVARRHTARGPAADRRSQRLRRAAGAGRRRADRAARRGQPRHARVLPRARAHHEAADRGARASRRSRSRPTGPTPTASTATCAAQATTPTPRRRCAASGASRPGCGATPTCSTSSAGCARTTTACATPSDEGRLLRARPLQPRRVDGGGHRLPRRARPRGGSTRPPALRVPAALLPARARRTGRPSCSASASPAGGACIEQLVELRRRAGDYLRRDGSAAEDEYFFAEQNARSSPNAEEYYRTMFGDARRLLEPARPPHGRHARPAHGAPRPPWRRRAASSSGRTTRTSATPAPPRWRSAASSTSAS